MDGTSQKDIFRYVLMAVFLAIAIGAVIVFATFKNETTNSSGGVSKATPVVMWGVLNWEVMNNVLESLDLEHVRYVEMNYNTYYGSFLEAVATGQSPDILLIDSSTLYQFLTKTIHIPYENYPEQTYKATFVEATEQFLANQTVLAVPFAINPMVMFWNRDTFTNAGLVSPPTYWDEFIPLTERFNEIDDSREISRSTIAFGEVQNVNNFKYILSTLMLQSGSPITYWEGAGLSVSLSQRAQNGEGTGASAVRFYTDFSNPTRMVYSWNRSLPPAQSAFVAGDLAVYFGFINEAKVIEQLNPNLNFDVALMPQIRGTQRRTTYAHVYGLVIPTTARNSAGAYTVLNTLTAQTAQKAFSEAMGLPSVRRDLASAPTTNTYWQTANDSAIISKSWVDPSHAGTYTSMANMVESIQSGELSISDAVKRAGSEFLNFAR